MSKTTVALPPSLAGWQARTLHTITCPSGQKLRIRIPGIGTLLEHGDLPDDLIDLALQELTHEGGAAGAVAAKAAAADVDRDDLLDSIRRLGAFQRELVKHAVREVWQDGEWLPVELDDQAVRDLPEDDLALVAEIVQRLRGTDARGVRIGVEPLDRWASFLETHPSPEHVAGGQDCEGCQALIQRFSSVDVGAV